MPAVPNQNLLLVEGKEEKRVIPEVIEKNGVKWEPTPKSYAVDIEDTEGVEGLLDEATLSTYGKRSGLRRLGIVIDGDSDPAARWQSLRHALLVAKLATDDQLTATIPREGLVVDGLNLRLGVWMMPDNTMSGMLETFLSQLVSSEQGKRLDQFVQGACLSALDHGATFKNPTQLAKARIHCWLAWQDEPGRQLHQAVLYGLLDAGAPQAKPFVSWFRSLFELA
jgi:hypothetical protein